MIGVNVRMSMIELIKNTLWNEHDIGKVDEETFNILKLHTIATLFAPSLSKIDMSSELRDIWTRHVLQQISYNANYKHLQSELPLSVPYVILKGSSAAKYYPHPEYRTMGDIDIITPREDFDKAYQELKNNGFVITKELEREVGFVKSGIMVELHRYFASLNDPKQAKWMDDLIIQNINQTHVLPDDINGLVLLEHINQHLEKGLGLRQIIDWMMFVDKCLPDERWPSFRSYAKAIGLEQLAIVATRMCEIYLGLPQRRWSNKADEKLCKQLLDYVMACGNFGNTRSDNIDIGDNILYYSSSLGSLFRLLQERGLANWETAKKYSILKPFAWIYQVFRYANRSMNRNDASATLKNEYKSARQRIKMFEALGVRQSTKGLSVYKKGRYKKSRTIL